MVELDRQVKGLESRVAALVAEAEERDQQIARQLAELGLLRDKVKELERFSNLALGLKGPMKNVVFVFDTSGSMKVNEFDNYREQLGAWISTLRFEKFAVVRFSTGVEAWPGTELADQARRPDALKFVQTFQAEGATNTREALERAADIRPG